MADVYVLASPAPTLYAYPSQLHPQSQQVALSGPVWRPTRTRQRRLDDDETVLAVLGAI